MHEPGFRVLLTPTTGPACDVIDVAAAADPAYTCDDASRNPPCRVTVTLTHVFHLFVPLRRFFGVQLGLPVTLTFDRDSTFAMTDIDVTTTPEPGP